MIKDQIAVIKFGGHALEDAVIKKEFYGELKEICASGARLVVVHGGGPQINLLLKRLDITSHFVDGLRYTDEKTLDAVEMALCASVNKEITRELLTSGIMACGLSGQDGQLLEARVKDSRLGLVGEITRVKPQILDCLLNGGFLPVVAPLGLDQKFRPLNINADTAAGAIAGALQADYFVLISDVPGVKNAQGDVLGQLTAQDVQEMIKSSVINGGMIPKAQSCLYALAHGCKAAVILDGSRKNALSQLLEKNVSYGTVISV